MLARVLLVLLAVPACRGAAYSDYYDADGGNDEADFYDSYNDEIQAPTLIATVMDAVTRIKKRGLEDIRTLNPAEIIDVKGALNNILHRTIPERTKGQQPVVRDYSDSYDYLENSNGMQKDTPGNVDRPNGNILFKKWLPTFQIKHWSPSTVEAHETMDYSSQPDQRLFNAYQSRAPSYSRKNEIIAQIRKMVPVFDGEVAAGSASVSVQPVDPAVDIQTSAIDVQNLHPAPDVKTLTTAADYSDSTQYNVMLQQESTLSNSEVQAEVRRLVPHWNLSGNVQHKSPLNNVQLWNISDSILNRKPPGEAQHWHPTTETSSWNISGNSLHRMPPGVAQHWSPKTEAPFWNISDNSPHWSPPGGAQHWSPNTEAPFWNLSDNILNRRPAGSAQHWNPTAVRHRPSNVQHWNPSDKVRHGNSTVEHWGTTDDAQHQNATTDDETDDTGGVFRAKHKKKKTTTEAYTGETTPPPKIDIDGILAILANLTYDYEWNLTEEFNKTLIDHGVPTCPWKNWVYEPWGPEGVYTATTTPTVPLYNFENASVVSKCFVCGLKTPEIPRDAYCADAFAGDFLPLMPVDPRSRGKIASYRKYCRYFDVHNWVEDAAEPRAIYGRFTGGCAVRWTDITGIYTQRTCRSKYRPLMGKHFASKRMAKLELALVNVEDGCIISPMATLLPVSRGISLYARFHACVCSTNWCNRATHAHSSLHTIIFVLACWLAHYT